MNLAEQLRAKREDILAIATKFGATNVRVFGSVARGKADSKSDIDILVSLRTEKKGLAYIGLLCDLQENLEHLLGKKVDLIDERALKGQTKERILKEAVSL
jgi:predicted nucleotidyltransferase